MKTKDKIKIAAWMDYEFIDRLHVKDSDGNWVVDGREYDPGIHLDQFTKVWNELSDAEQGMVIDKTKWPDKIAGNQRLFVHDVLNNTPHVMAVIMDVI